MVRGGKVALKAVSREKSRRNTGILEYKTQQESGLVLHENENSDTIMTL